MKTFRLIRSRPSSAVYNMETDKKIFNRYLEDGIPVFRVYRWQSPSFTYGVTQDPEKWIDLELCASEKIGIAGRMTGGGVLFHDNEITYSLACGKQDAGEPQGPIVSYREICAFLIKFYESIGLEASFALESESFKNRCVPNALCSASYEKYDIIINNRKIGGNAQKRKRQVIFQHGSIPCAINWDIARRYLKSLPGDMSLTVTSLSEELALVPDKDALEQKLIDAFSLVFGARFIEEKELLHETVVA
jgi:lipoyl(octanoyl) transferase